jgi:hypothetical protein
MSAPAPPHSSCRLAAICEVVVHDRLAVVTCTQGMPLTQRPAHAALGSFFLVHGAPCPSGHYRASSKLGPGLIAAGCLYSPSCRQGVFSETRIQPSESSCIRGGVCPAPCPVRHIMLPQHLVAAYKYPAITLSDSIPRPLALRGGYQADSKRARRAAWVSSPSGPNSLHPRHWARLPTSVATTRMG